MEEVFKTLEDYPDYAFSNRGRMLNKKTGKFLTLNSHNRFALTKNRNSRCMPLSKLTQKYFPEPIILLSKDEYFEYIPDFPNYKISTYGRVYNNELGMFLKPSISKTGYYVITLCNKGYLRKIKNHKILAEAFIYNDDPINKTQIDHIDRNKLNNHISNLRWVSPSENLMNRVFMNKYPKYIDTCKKGNNNYWRLQIVNPKCNYRKCFNCKKYTLEEVKEIRNKILKAHGIEQLDCLN